jgi:putative DNA primase/helicase
MEDAPDNQKQRSNDDSSMERWAEDLHAEADGAYIETTVSGRGLRIIGTAEGGYLDRKFRFGRTGAGIEVYRNATRYITVSGLERGTCQALPPLDNLLDTLFARHSKTKQSNGFDFNKVGRLDAHDYERLIRNGAPEGERSEPFQSVVWHLAGQGWTVEAITDELVKYPNGIGAKYADRLFEEVTRSYDKWRTHKRQATGCDAETAGMPWPQIYVVPGELPRVVNEAETALLGLKREIYQRGGRIVRPVLNRLAASDDRETQGWQLVPVTRPYLVETLTRAARFLKHDRRAKGAIPTDAPDKGPETYLARHGTWNLPLLTGMTTAPFLRVDGSVCEDQGYDAATGLLYKPECEFSRVPSNPSRDDAQKALNLIETGLLTGFPFVTPTDRAVSLSGILTPLDRYAMAHAPLHGYTAPMAGTGKSKLVDINAVLSTGRVAPVISQGNDEKELEKRLGGCSQLSIDMIALPASNMALQSVFLNQVLTQKIVSIRLLGLSCILETPTTATIFCTGNNLIIAGDLTRRSLRCSLDAKCEHPEQRRFNCDAVDIAKARRAELVTAGLTVLRAWHLSGTRGNKLPLGGFETWSHRIRDALLWLGRADPCTTIQDVKAEDPAVMALTAVMAQWRRYIGLQRVVTQQEVIKDAVKVPDFLAALMNVAEAKSGKEISKERLGRWLNDNNGRIVKGTSLRRVGNDGGYPRWKLTLEVGVVGV